MRYEITPSAAHTYLMSTSQSGMKTGGLDLGFRIFDAAPSNKYPNYKASGIRKALVIQERKVKAESGEIIFDVFKLEGETDYLFPTGDIPEDATTLHSGPLGKRIFEIISQETAEKIAPTVVQFAFRGESLTEEQPLLGRVRQKGRSQTYDQGNRAMGNRMQTIIDRYFERGSTNFNFVFHDGSDEYVIPIDGIGSAENLQLPTEVPIFSKAPRPPEEHGKPLPIDPSKIGAYDTAFQGFWGREDDYPNLVHSMGLQFVLSPGDYGKIAYLASLGSGQSTPSGHIWSEIVEGLLGVKINKQDPQTVASGGLLSPKGIVNRAETLAVPFAIGMATSVYMVNRREQRRDLLNPPS